MFPPGSCSRSLPSGADRVPFSLSSGRALSEFIYFLPGYKAFIASRGLCFEFPTCQPESQTCCPVPFDLYTACLDSFATALTCTASRASGASGNPGAVLSQAALESAVTTLAPTCLAQRLEPLCAVLMETGLLCD